MICFWIILTADCFRRFDGRLERSGLSPAITRESGLSPFNRRLIVHVKRWAKQDETLNKENLVL